MARLLVNHLTNVFERDGEIARDARDHGVRIAQRHHRRSEIVAVGVDEAHAIAPEIALTLQLLVEVFRVDGVAL